MKKIISVFTAMMVFLIAIVGSVSELSIPVSAANTYVESLGITYKEIVGNIGAIFANGNAIIIADKDGNAATINDTLIYLDTNRNGVIDGAETPVNLNALSGFPTNIGNTTTGYNLSWTHIFGGCYWTSVEYSFNSVTKTQITMTGGTVYYLYGGGTGSNSYVDEGTDITISGSSHIVTNVYGGGINSSVVYNKTNINITGSAQIDGSVFGGGLNQSVVKGNTNINISDEAKINGSVYGGGENAIYDFNGIPIFGMTGDSNVIIKGNASVAGSVFGGGYEDVNAYTNAVTPIYAVYGNTNVDISESAHITGSLWGGGDGYAKTGGKAFINISDEVSIATVNGSGNTSSATILGSYIINQPAKTITVSGDITLPQNLTVSPDQTMTILNDSILRIPSGMTLENNGTIINNKTIVNNGTISGTGILKNVITYVLNGGVNNPANTNYYAYGSGLTLQDPTYHSQKFGGWYTNADYAPGSKVVSFGSNETAAKTIYAKWIDPAAHTVTYDANGATGGTVPTDTHTYAAGATVPVAGNPGELAKTGYTFGGWSTSPNGAAVTAYTMCSSDVTFYAVWNLTPKYTVTYNANGATKGTVPTDSNTYAAGANVPLAENTGSLTKTGYTFGGWSTTPNGTAVATYTMGSGNITFYAVWTADNNSAGSPISVSSPEQPISITLPQNIGLPHPELISARPIGNAFDEPARLSISPATEKRFREALRTANRPLPSDNDAFYFEMDMFSQRTGEKLQPKEGTTVKITFPVPTELLAHKENLRTVCVIGGKLNLLPTTIMVKNNTVCAEFPANHFSPYALIIDRDGSFSSLAAGAPANEISTPIEQPSGVPYIILSLGLTAGIIFFNIKRLKSKK